MVNIIRASFRLRKGIGEQGVRTASTPDPYQRWLASEIETIRHCHSVPELAAYLGSSNSYMREAALARSVELALPELLPAIAARLNDWVPAVRRAATPSRLTSAPHLPAPT